MKKDNRIRSSIDESLSSVHFDARDMHRVLRAVRDQEMPRAVPSKRRQRPLGLVFATAMAALVIVPVSLLVLRAGSIKPMDITAITAQGSITPAVTAASTPQDPLLAPSNSPVPVPAIFTEDDAIAFARTCFQEHCDTSIFTFDEYTVSTSFSEGDDGFGEYRVEMNSIYGNGCSFSVVVSARGEILSYSTPRLATVPTRLSSDSEEIRAWYDKYGEQLYTWPLDVQAEFSRRYEGGLLRAPREGEMTEEAISSIAQSFSRDWFGLSENETISTYATLCSERAFSDNLARFQVYCFYSGMPDDCLLLTMSAAAGEIESSEVIARDSL